MGWTRSGITGGYRASFHVTFCVTDGGIPNTGLVLEVSGMGVSTAQDLCSALPQFFYVCHWGAPIKGSRRSEPKPGHRLPMAEVTAWRRRRLEQMIVVETVDAEVYAAAAWTPWLRFVRCWPVGARREEGLL